MKNTLTTLFFALFLVPFLVCAGENPPAPGFNQSASDLAAIHLADKVMAAMGGRENWDKTRYLSWNFFGKRKHVWDRYTGRVRVSQPEKGWLVLMNINDKTGRAFEDGKEITDPKLLEERLSWGYECWVNDSYWLIMPYKLKDTGVTLRTLGEGTTATGEDASLLQLTFEDVGVTPENKYWVYVDRNSHLVVQWDFFKSFTDEEPQFSTPWADWQRYGSILLSGDRGKMSLTDIAVHDSLPEAAFEDPEWSL